MRRILAVGGLVTGLALGFVAGSGLGRTSAPVATCTAAQHAARVHAVASYRRRVPRDRAAYFHRHHGSHQRARYVHAQQARLNALEQAASCQVPKPKPHTTTNPISSPSTTTSPAPPVSTTTAAGTMSTASTTTTTAAAAAATSTTTSTTTTTVPNPPAAAVSYAFGPELGTADRAWVMDEGDAAGAWLQALTGVTLDPVKIYAYADPHGLAVGFQKQSGLDPSIIPTKEAQYRAGNTAAEALFHAAFLNLFQTADWNSGPDNRQKIVAHELFHLEQEQLANAPTGVPPSNGPMWLVEGSAEAMGYRVAAARAMLDLAAERAGVAARVRGTSVTLTSLETYAGLTLPHAWDTLHLAADHLVAIAPNGVGSFVDFFAAVGHGTEWHAAFLGAFGMTSTQYYTAFDAYRAGL